MLQNLSAEVWKSDPTGRWEEVAGIGGAARALSRCPIPHLASDALNLLFFFFLSRLTLCSQISTNYLLSWSPEPRNIGV